MKFYCFIALLIITISCQSNTPKILQPTKVLETKTAGTIEYYDFDALSPLFEYENDTTYVINFWATWCAPCVKELPHFEALGRKYQNDKVKIVLVSLDFSNKITKSLIPFLEKNSLKSKVVLLDDADANAWINKVDPKWTGALPATIIYKNKSKAFFEKSFTFEELDKEFTIIQKN